MEPPTVYAIFEIYVKFQVQQMVTRNFRHTQFHTAIHYPSPGGKYSVIFLFLVTPPGPLSLSDFDVDGSGSARSRRFSKLYSFFILLNLGINFMNSFQMDG
uniref:Uncharacterized protein n=1 Tax=Cacopsylla melanoneura TaxID=428564 RepID=A0A8D9BHB8_9HEMI